MCCVHNWGFRAESAEADLAAVRAAYIPSAHAHTALHPLPMPPPSASADWELHETTERLAALGEAQRCVARQQAGAVDLLESENVRLVQMKNATDLERDVSVSWTPPPRATPVHA